MKCIESFFIIKLMFTFKVEHIVKLRLHCQDYYTATFSNVVSYPSPTLPAAIFQGTEDGSGDYVCVFLGRVRRSEDSNQIADTCVIMSKSHVSYVCAHYVILCNHHVILCNHHQGILYILPGC